MPFDHLVQGGDHDCFNPRPPFPGGDAAMSLVKPGIVIVSIHAPRFREAMPALQLRGLYHRSVSIHAPRFREAMPRAVLTLPVWSTCFNPRPPFPGGDAFQDTAAFDALSDVSIHAPRFREAMPGNPARHDRRYVFQSTPPVSGRRCHDWVCAWALLGEFQSTPPVSGRRCQRTASCNAGPDRVSIHAPRFREAMPHVPND